MKQTWQQIKDKSRGAGKGLYGVLPGESEEKRINIDGLGEWQLNPQCKRWLRLAREIAGRAYTACSACRLTPPSH